MKTRPITMKHSIPLVLILLTLLFLSCSKTENPPPSPETEENENMEENNNSEDINGVIANLTYNADVLLNVQDTGGAASERTLTDEAMNTSGPNLGEIQECRTQDYSLESNFDDVAILRPTNGVIYPGALIIGNEGMLDGAPDPLTLARAPMTLRLDLPGIGDQGNIVVDNATNSSVQSNIDNALEWWNDNAYQEGYVNASNSSYQATTSYSSKQFSLDVGLNLEWATGSLASQFEYESTTTRRIAAVVFKQVFYTVTLDTPDSPGSVFAASVTKEQAEAAFDSDAPPAYVSSVSYGRIIMVRMETTNVDTSINLNAVLEYAGGVSGTGTVNSTYDAVLKNSSLTVVTIGGNAEAASEAISSANIQDGPGSLNSIITGENAVYSRNNPGVPIAYTIRYLKDNTFAKMGYTTDYRIENCGTFAYGHKNAFVKKDISQTMRFRFSYKKKGSQDFATTGWTEVGSNNVKVGAKPPAGAHDVRIQFEFLDVFVWKTMGEFDLGYLSSDRCFEGYCSNFFIICTEISVRSVGC
ncbi:MAG: thiol-activated cytolysin family protein [Aurantibacter sp.]